MLHCLKKICSVTILILLFSCTYNISSPSSLESELELDTTPENTLQINNAPTFLLSESTGILFASNSRGSSLSISWRSSNPEVLSITKHSGRYKAIGRGTTTITATADSETGTILSASTQITITKVYVPAQSIHFVNLPSIFLKSDRKQIIATASPENHTDGQFHWSSSDPSVVSINAETGIINALRTGEVTITASIGKRETIEASFNAVVLGVAESLNIFTTATLTLGSTGTFHSLVLPLRNINGPVQWNSNDSNILSIDSDTGTYEARKVGETTISAFIEDENKNHLLTQERVITVVDEAILANTITIDSSPLTLISRSSGILTATVSPENYSNEIVRWTSDNPHLLYINELTGKYQSISTGDVNVRATISQNGNQISDVITLSITNPVKSINLSGIPENAFGYGYRFTIKPTIVPYTTSVPHSYGQINWSYPKNSISLISIQDDESATFKVISKNGRDAIINISLGSVFATAVIHTLPLIEPSDIILNKEFVVWDGHFTVLREEGMHISQAENKHYIWTSSTNHFIEDERADISLDRQTGAYTIQKRGRFTLELTKLGNFPGSDETITFASKTINMLAYPSPSLRLSTNGNASTTFTNNEEGYVENNLYNYEINLELESTNTILSSASDRGIHQSILSIEDSGTKTLIRYSSATITSAAGITSDLPQLVITENLNKTWTIHYDLTHEITSTIPAGETRTYPVGRLIFTIDAGLPWETKLIVHIQFIYINYS